MRSILYLLTTLAVMGMAFWAYRENYRTQAAFNDMERVQREIASLRDDLGVLRAEWAFLNRPARLRELVSLNIEQLKLVPFTAEQFVDVRQVAYRAVRPSLPMPGFADPAMGSAVPPEPPVERPAGFPPLRPQESTP
ncbi:cell division protein FtsL [Paracoccus ravus]|uniref:cell division protein FtsL n=1 Tax=Paracoccus ravus TaxID=2447760 RepID=UPI00106E08ED|nr:cell division protein FtsL [Paracoccus ravus]